MPASSLSSNAPTCSTRSASSNTAPKTTPPRPIISCASAVNTPPEEDSMRIVSSRFIAPKTAGLFSGFGFPTGHLFSQRSQEMHSA